MILAFDTYYFDGKAKTVCLSFDNWKATSFKADAEITEHIEDYQPGAFYKRELPCILSLLHQIKSDNIEAIIVDGFVFLDDDNSLGLGGHLYKALNEKIPVIGVAKTNFATIKKNKREIYRGQSQRPLYITAIGMDADMAAALIKGMPGTFRIPNLLKQLDTLTKQLAN